MVRLLCNQANHFTGLQTRENPSADPLGVCELQVKNQCFVEVTLLITWSEVILFFFSVYLEKVLDVFNN